MEGRPPMSVAASNTLPAASMRVIVTLIAVVALLGCRGASDFALDHGEKVLRLVP
jgi:hypothetical protein